MAVEPSDAVEGRRRRGVPTLTPSTGVRVSFHRLEDVLPLAVRFVLGCVLLCVVALPPMVRAQASLQESTPFSIWLDLPRRAAASWPQTGLPFWVSGVIGFTVTPAGQPGTTTIEIGLRNLGNLNNRMELRLFFDDVPGAGPTITGRGPNDAQVFTKGPLGQGLGLATSEMLTFAAASVDDVEISVPGDGHNLRGIFLVVLKSEEIEHALDFAVPTNLIEALACYIPLFAIRFQRALKDSTAWSIWTFEALSKLRTPMHKQNWSSRSCFPNIWRTNINNTTVPTEKLASGRMGFDGFALLKLASSIHLNGLWLLIRIDRGPLASKVD